MFRRLLIDLCSEARVVDVRRSFIDPQDLRGRVLRVSEDLALLVLIGEEGTWDGLSVIRIEDITMVRYGNRQLSTWERALAAAAPPAVDHLSLSSWDSFLRTASRQGEVATLLCEANDPQGGFSGRNFVARGEVILADQITADGESDGRFGVLVNTITRVNVGGAYERSLQRLSHFLDLEQKN